jgi:hypothetical protein
MASAPEHYRKAEEHLDWADVCRTDDPPGEKAHLRYAAVHAALAGVAVQAVNGGLEWAELLRSSTEGGDG